MLRDKTTSESRPSGKMGMDIARLAGPNYPQIDPLTICQEGAEKLWADLDRSKSPVQTIFNAASLRKRHMSWPQCLLVFFFKQSISTTTLLKVWTDAFLAWVFKWRSRCSIHSGGFLKSSVSKKVKIHEPPFIDRYLNGSVFLLSGIQMGHYFDSTKKISDLVDQHHFN